MAKFFPPFPFRDGSCLQETKLAPKLWCVSSVAAKPLAERKKQLWTEYCWQKCSLSIIPCKNTCHYCSEHGIHKQFHILFIYKTFPRNKQRSTKIDSGFLVCPDTSREFKAFLLHFISRFLFLKGTVAHCQTLPKRWITTEVWKAHLKENAHTKRQT